MSANDRALIVYETMFGNTERIARAIRPTHAFSMSRLSTRQDAWKQGDVVMPIEVGIREWLGALKPASGSHELRVTTFDTRIAKVRRLPGSAARSAAKLLRRRGYRMLSTSGSFFVDETTGPIHDAEIERAERWGQELGRLLTGSTQVV